MSELALAILNSINAKPGQKAIDIATQLNIERKDVNALLYGELRSKVRQDKNYRWYPKDSSDIEREEQSQELNTPLAKLCKYYLDCLSHDDMEGVSVYASSYYGDLDYIELSSLPMFNTEGDDPFNSSSGQRLLGRIRRDQNRKVVILGYPVRLNFKRSRNGWEGFFVEPLLLFPFHEPEGRFGKPTLTADMPQINIKALKSLSNSGDVNLMEESILLSEELGLASTIDDQPALDELFERLKEIRAEWDWHEKIDPYNLSIDAPIPTVNDQGIYNKAVLVTTERSQYTKGLESELSNLNKIVENTYRNTALGVWLDGKTIDSPLPDMPPLIEVLPLNSEQRQAVRQSLSNQLTVITGPPGTGKSQVVTSILINAAWQGKTVLFASKNNKAVDVVEARVNNLGPRPVLLRLGASQYQSMLAEYLIALLASSSTTEDQSLYNEYEENHRKLEERSELLDKKLNSLVELRNRVDRLEQNVEQIRQCVGEEIFQKLGWIEPEKLNNAAQKLILAINFADRQLQPFFKKLFWALCCENHFLNLSEAAKSFLNVSRDIGLPLPDRNPDRESVQEWISYRALLEERVTQANSVLNYFYLLDELTEAESFEELCHERQELTDDLSSNSEKLWNAWLRLQPSRMSSQQRRLLGDYSSILQLMVSADQNDQHIGRDVFRRYYQLFPQITSILSCWAVTSLSARGRIPFEPNFFDLLIIDEASQCDIASALPLLYRARRVVVIGDPKQLRHISTLSKQQDQQSLSQHGLLEDYPGWAYSTRSLFDLASSLCRSEDIVSLRDHHRSHADIIEFSNGAFYEGRLRVATRYDRLLKPWNDQPAARWIDVRGKVVRPSTGGALNDVEANAVVKEIERLLDQGYRGSIGVVSPFRAQANRIQDLVFSHRSLGSRIADLNFLADTVHKFQGDERDVMFFSPVVSEGISDRTLSFLRNTPNLFNVAITRARAALIVVGDKSAALNCNVDYLSQFAAYTETIKKKGVNSINALQADLGPAYPSVSSPELVSEWEKYFYKALYNSGIRPIPQYSVEKYLLDFAVINGDRRLNIEIDGERYHRNWDGELCRRDQIRNQRLMELGWDVMRFWVYQVRDDLDKCLDRVKDWLLVVKK